jgi:hypothetical protein
MMRSTLCTLTKQTMGRVRRHQCCRTMILQRTAKIPLNSVSQPKGALHLNPLPLAHRYRSPGARSGESLTACQRGRSRSWW